MGIETEFTPGPWFALPTIPEQGWEGYAIHANTNIGYVTTIAEVSGPQRKTKEANAVLIAAAPDLYEALDQAVTSMQDSGYQNSHIAVRAARDALAKARGEQ